MASPDLQNETPQAEHRKIIHVDMDAFFASVEQRDFPELRGKPVAVGGSGERGVVAAASYEARKFGVRSAMPSAIARRKCPDLIFVKHRFGVYREVSQQIRAIFHEYTDLVEPLSLDEAYLDVTHNKKGIQSATLIAREIKARIQETTQLTASAGISINKFLAKIASDMDKPNGLFVIPPDKAVTFVESLDIEKFHGIGKATATKMHQMGIFKGIDLKNRSLPELSKAFGKAGRHYYHISRAIDNRAVNPNRIRKSMSAENTFEYDLTSHAEMDEAITPIVEKVIRWMDKHEVFGKTLTLKVKFSDFTQVTRSKTYGDFITDPEVIIDGSYELIRLIDREPLEVRLLGLGISNLNTSGPEPIGQQLTLEF